MNIALWIAQGLLALIFLFAGGMKLVMPIEEMMKQDLNVGGEQSGHMIFRDFSTTGDGIVSALQILRIMVETGEPLSELRKCLRKYPQAQRNLKVRDKIPIEQMPDVHGLQRDRQQPLARQLLESRPGDAHDSCSSAATQTSGRVESAPQTAEEP